MCEGGPLYNFEAAEQVRRGKERRLVATAAAPSATACAEVCIATFGCEGVGCRHDAGVSHSATAAAAEGDNHLEFHFVLHWCSLADVDLNLAQQFVVVGAFALAPARRE